MSCCIFKFQGNGEMFDELDIYKQSGHFIFRRGQSLLMVSKDVPESAGIYLIYLLRKGKVELAYIGASGTINQKGKFSTQLLKGRINNKQDGIKRQAFFEENMEKDTSIEALDIYWYVTFEKEIQHLPGYVEAILLQRYFDVHGCLPEWNKKFPT